MTETGDLSSLVPGFTRSVFCLLANIYAHQPGLTYSTLCCLSNLQLLEEGCRVVGVVVVVGVKGRWVEGGRRERPNQLVEKRKLCHIQEEVWVSARTFLQADSALHRKWETLTAKLWHQEGKNLVQGGVTWKRVPQQKNKTKNKQTPQANKQILLQVFTLNLDHKATHRERSSLNTIKRWLPLKNTLKTEKGEESLGYRESGNELSERRRA